MGTLDPLGIITPRIQVYTYSPRPRPKRSEVPIRIPSIPHLLIPSPLTPTPPNHHREGGGGGVPLCEPKNEPQGPAVKFRLLQWISPPPPSHCNAQTLSLFTAQTLHPALLQKEKAPDLASCLPPNIRPGRGGRRAAFKITYTLGPKVCQRYLFWAIFLVSGYDYRS